MADPRQLFRRQSLEARGQSWLGRPIILPDIPTAVFAGASLIFVLAIVLFLTLGEYTRRVRVTGVVLPQEGLTRMAAPQPGWITDIKVREGDKVSRGDVLYTLSVDVTTALGNTQDQVADILNKKREELRRSYERQSAISIVEKRLLTEQIADLERELPQLDEQLSLLEEATAQLADFAQRQEDLLQQGISISREYEARLQAYNAERAQIPRLRRERVQLEARVNELRIQLSGFDLRAAAGLGDIERQIFDIEQQISESEARRELAITAPRAGSITGIITLAGQTVSAGTPLLTIVPTDQPLVVQLLAPSNAIGFVRENTPVLLRYEAFPYQKFGQYGAHVSVISRANLRPEEVSQFNATFPGAIEAPSLYRITAVPDQPFVHAYGKTEPLQAGMQVEAHLLVETRPLYQWVLEPLYGLRGGLTSAPSS